MDKPTIEEVLQYLQRIKRFYEEVKGLGPIELYKILCDLEEEYILKKDESENSNFCQIVHKLHADVYYNDMMALRRVERVQEEVKAQSGAIISAKEDEEDDEGVNLIPNTTIFTYPLKQLFKCPTCGIKLSIEQCFRIHILDEVEQCRSCGDEVCFECLAVQAFLHKYHTDRPSLLAPFHNVRSEWFPDQVGEVRRWDALALCLTGPEHSWEARDIVLTLVAKHQRNASSLGVDLVRGAVRALTLVARFGVFFRALSRSPVLRQALALYAHLLELQSVHPEEVLVGTLGVALVAQAHCVSGRIVPSCAFALPANGTNGNGNGIDGKAYRYAQTCILYARHFGVAYAPSRMLRYAPDLVAWRAYGEAVAEEESMVCGLGSVCCLGLGLGLGLVRRWQAQLVLQSYLHTIQTTTNTIAIGIGIGIGTSNPLTAQQEEEEKKEGEEQDYEEIAQCPCHLLHLLDDCNECDECDECASQLQQMVNEWLSVLDAKAMAQEEALLHIDLLYC